MGVFALLAGILMRRWWAAPAVAALWVAIEVTHGSLGFAWLALGNAGIDMGVPMRLAPFTGVYGLSFLFALMAAVAGARHPAPSAHRVAVAARSCPLLALLPRMPEPRDGSATALLAQPNISETEEWTPGHAGPHDAPAGRALAAGRAGQTGQPPPELVVWPEVPAPLYYYEDERFRAYVNGLARMTRAYLLIGVVAHTPDGAPLNSAALISPSGVPVSRYDKVNLVPFGEFVPWPFGFAEPHLDRGRRLLRRQARRRLADRRPPARRVHLLRIGLPELRPQVRQRRRGSAGEHLERRLVRQQRRAPAASLDRPHARRREPPLGPALHQ